MPDIISAKCFGCGHVIRVPLSLGGRKARCPQCAEDILIPKPSEGEGEFVPDDRLPEVARDEDILEATAEKDVSDDIPVGIEVPSVPPRRPQASRKPGAIASSKIRAVPKRGGGADHRRAGYAPSRKSSATAIVVAVGVAFVALIGLALALSRGSTGSAVVGDKAPSNTEPEVTQDDPALESRCRAYLAAFNRKDIQAIVAFYSYERAEEIPLKGAISAQLEQGIGYERASIKSASARTGAVTIVHSKGEKTLIWKKVDGTWLIAERP